MSLENFRRYDRNNWRKNKILEDNKRRLIRWNKILFTQNYGSLNCWFTVVEFSKLVIISSPLNRNKKTGFIGVYKKNLSFVMIMGTLK